jgi:signal transduction histidine kinase
MNDARHDPSAVIALRHQAAATAIAAAAAVTGTLVLASWIWNLPGLNRIHPVLGGMGTYAAVCLMLAGSAALLVGADASRPARLTGMVAAAAVVLIAGLTLAGVADQSIGRVLPGRMPTSSAQVFLLLGLALLLIDVQVGRWRPSEFLSACAAFIAILALVAYAFGNVSVLSTVKMRPLAFHTVFLMLGLSFAVFAARPQSGLMALATSDSAAGVLVRRMVPAVAAIPVVLGVVAMELQRAQVVPPLLTLSYYATAIIVVIVAVTWRTALTLHRIDLQRRDAQEQVETLNADLERRVAERTAQLERVNAELEAFSYSVSHDLRAPVRHIDGFAHLVASRYGAALDADGRRQLNLISDSAKNMGRMIDDLLSLARLERQAPSMEITDLDVLVRGIIQVLSRDAGSRVIEWQCDALPPVQCDPGLIKLVFTNLLANAVKYTGRRERAAITVSCRREGRDIVFAIADNGAGFDEQYRNKLFGVFQRLHRAEEFEGTGIGLATVRRIVHKHGGRVWAEGAVGHGATFSFTLPQE